MTGKKLYVCYIGYRPLFAYIRQKYHNRRLLIVRIKVAL
jgi:hypothetical protein